MRLTAWLHLGSAVATLAVEDIAGEALAMWPDKRCRTAVPVRRKVARTITESERQVFPSVDQSIEGEETGGRGVSVGEPQRHSQVGAHRSGRRNV